MSKKKKKSGGATPKVESAKVEETTIVEVEVEVKATVEKPVKKAPVPMRQKFIY